MSFVEWLRSYQHELDSELGCAARMVDTYRPRVSGSGWPSWRAATVRMADQHKLDRENTMSLMLSAFRKWDATQRWRDDEETLGRMP